MSTYTTRNMRDLCFSGTKLRSLLIKHGSMKTIEVEITKWHEKSSGTGKKGKWVTRYQLETVHHYSTTPGLTYLIYKYILVYMHFPYNSLVVEYFL